MDPLDTGLGSPAPRLNHAAEERAVEICARLLIDRYVAKREYRDLLLDDELRAIVGRRLQGVGLQLVESFSSDYFAVRLRRDIEADISLDWATNSRMPRGAVALLVIMWAKLVLPKHIARSEEALQRQVQASGSGETAAEAATPDIYVERDALYAEFGRKFGKTAFSRYVGTLKSSAFVREDRQGRLREGPLLDLLVDGVQMAQKLRDSVLWDLLERGGVDVPEGQSAAEEDEDFEEDA